MHQKLYSRAITLETNWKIDYHYIDSEDDEITEDLFKAVLRATDFESKIISITREE